MLPVEILHVIAAESPLAYRALLSLPPFAWSLDPGIIADYMIHFGHSVEIDGRCTRWYYHGKPHRLDGPAVENIHGTSFWYKEGKLRRADGPSIIYVTGYREWYFEGRLHRLDGPATGGCVYGGESWWQNGKMHRVGGPAQVFYDGSKRWLQNGLLHGIGGPAVEDLEGMHEWYFRGVRYFGCKSETYRKVKVVAAVVMTVVLSWLINCD